MEYLHALTLWFRELPLKRQITLSAALVLIVAITVLLSFWALSPSYAVLFTQLDEQDAQRIIGQLDHANIRYELRHDGSDILIDKRLIAKTRLTLMSSGTQLSGTVGFELFDKNDFGMTDFSQKINYQRALQGELERTISSLDEVRQARVHLVIPEQHLFAPANNKPKAAVTVHLKKQLSSKQVRSIQQLLSASVAHLSLNQVLVVDQNGNTLSLDTEDQSNAHLTTKKTIERYLGNKAQQMLAQIFPQQPMMVKVDASINYDELQRELIKPQSDGLITHEKKVEHLSRDKNAKEDRKQDISFEKSYQLGSKKEVLKRATGTIERLSISVVLPEHTSPKIIEQVNNLVQNAVGFNAQRGDKISIEALISPAITTKPLPQHAIEQQEKIQVTSLQVFYCCAFLLCCATASSMIVRRIRHKKRQAVLLELSQWLNQQGVTQHD